MFFTMRKLIMDDAKMTYGIAPVRAIIITLDRHLEAAVERAGRSLAKDAPGLILSLHAAVDWQRDPAKLERVKAAIANADILVVNMLFLEDHIKAILPELQERCENCDAFVGTIAAGEVIKCTRMGQLDMGKEARGPLALLKKLRGSRDKKTSDGAGQMAMLRRLPKFLKFIPGTAQDLRCYFLAMSYWLSGSEVNIANMVRMLVNRYANGPRKAWRGTLEVAPPVEYPDVGLYHPSLPARCTASLEELDKHRNVAGNRAEEQKPRVGVLLMRSYVLAGDCAHFDAVIDALEARGLEPIPAFAAGLDARPAINSYFMDEEGRTTVDCVMSLTGFSLVGGPAYNDSDAASEILSQLDVPYMPVHSLEFQSLGEWQTSAQGLSPIETTMMVALPELEGGTNPMIFAGRDIASNMVPCKERVARLADRVKAVVTLRRTERQERRLAITLFNFPPGAGAAGTAAHLSVYQSLYRLLRSLADEGYRVDVPESVDALRDSLLADPVDAASDFVVHDRVSREDHIRTEPYLSDIEKSWGPAPGQHCTDGRNILICGKRFGNVFVGLQPGLGIEDDPMRLLFEQDFAPTHAMSAYYRYIRDTFKATALLHFGTHGGLEFLPGKQSGLSEKCWPERLIGAVPHYYLYAANNPSEGTIAKRRSAATVVSYLTPPLARAGLYKGYASLHDLVGQWTQSAGQDAVARGDLLKLIGDEAVALDLLEEAEAERLPSDEMVRQIRDRLREMQSTAIPDGLHILGQPMSSEGRRETLSIALDCIIENKGRDEQNTAVNLPQATRQDLVTNLLDGTSAVTLEKQFGLDRDSCARLIKLAGGLGENAELQATVRALDGTYVPPSPAGDLIHTPEIMPTGRNIHGFDPFRIPTALAVATGKRQADCLLAELNARSETPVRSVAFVLWGTDNIKTGGNPIGQVLALIGAVPRLDAYGRLCGATLLPISDFGRPRVDVVLTISGIFRDLLPAQARMLAEAMWLAASAEDESAEDNPIRANTLAHMESTGCDFETAAMRVFANSDGAYGANVNRLIDSGMWEDDAELAECYGDRKCFAIDRTGHVVKNREMLESVLGTVEAAYQNIDSVELGVTTIDHYFDTLGGIAKAVAKTRGIDKLPVLLGDQTTGREVVRSLEQQVALEARTRTLNPKWYDSMLAHGYEGVRHIEAAVTNTLGWSATTGAVEPWVYDNIAQTFMLDEDMKNRLAELNPAASSKLTNRLREAYERTLWTPDESTRQALEDIADELEDRLEGIAQPLTLEREAS